MKKSQTELNYLRAAAQNATSAGLVIILYDLLVNDLEQAIAALADRDIERRTAEIKHSFLVLQQLEGSLDMENGGVAARNLAAFYSALRSKIFEAHLKASPEILKQQIEFVLDVRQAWHQVDAANTKSATPTGPESSSQTMEHSMAAAAGGGDTASMNWSA
jgi:flagellar biosynthetic protein FliS